MKLIEALNKILTFILLLVTTVTALYFFADIIRFPEMYKNKYRYDLYNALQSGDKAASEYYETNYVANGYLLY